MFSLLPPRHIPTPAGGILTSLCSPPFTSEEMLVARAIGRVADYVVWRSILSMRRPPTLASLDPVNPLSTVMNAAALAVHFERAGPPQVDLLVLNSVIRRQRAALALRAAFLMAGRGSLNDHLAPVCEAQVSRESLFSSNRFARLKTCSHC